MSVVSTRNARRIVSLGLCRLAFIPGNSCRVLTIKVLIRQILVAGEYWLGWIFCVFSM